MAADPLTLDQAAAHIRASASDRVRLRIFFEFIRGVTEEPDVDVAAVVAHEPAPTGDERFDALLAAAAEHVTARAGLPAPAWCHNPERTLHHAWWIDDLPSSRAFAIVNTPASFHKRAIYLDAHDLESA